MNLFLFHARSNRLIGLLMAVACVQVHAESNPSLILGSGPDAVSIELTGTVEVDAAGDIRATPVDPDACSAPGGGGEPGCADVAVGQAGFLGNAAPNLEVNEGDQVAFSWDSLGAWGCEAAGDLPGWDYADLAPRSDLDERRNFDTSGLAREQPYSATLLCNNGPVQSNNGVAEIVTLTVSEVETPPPTACADRLPPAGWRRLSTGPTSCVYQGGWVASANCEQFTGIWPGPIMEINNISVGLGIRDSSQGKDYIAIAFDTDGLQPSGRGVIALNITSSLSSRQKTITISECPGDFHTDKIPAGCARKSTVQNITWGGAASNADCKLEPDRTYYLNVIYTDSPLDTKPNEIVPQPDCASGTRCGNLFSTSAP